MWKISQSLYSLCLLAAAAVGLGDPPHPAEASRLPTQEAATAPSSPVPKDINGCHGLASPFYRYWNKDTSDRYYTTNFDDIGYGRYGYVLEGEAGKLVDSSFKSCGAVELYHYYNKASSINYYTTDWSQFGYGDQGWIYQNTSGYCFGSAVTGTVPLYHYWNQKNNRHLYTTNYNELGTGGYDYGLTGIQCYVVP